MGPKELYDQLPERPNYHMNRSQLIEWCEKELDLAGKCHVVLVRNQFNDPIEFWPASVTASFWETTKEGRRFWLCSSIYAGRGYSVHPNDVLEASR